MILRKNCRDFALCYEKLALELFEDCLYDPSPNTVNDLRCWEFLEIIQMIDLMPVNYYQIKYIFNDERITLTCESLSIKVSSTSDNCNVSGPFRLNEPVAGTCGYYKINLYY